MPGATRYHVQLSASSGFATLLIDQDTYALAHSPSTALADGTYYWRVKALIGSTWGAYSPAWAFEKDWSDGGAIRAELISPPEGAERTSFTPEDFSWTPVPGAATYRFEISPDPSFSSITYSKISIKPHHTPIDRLANNTYYWRVTPVDHRGNLGAASDVRSFRFNWNLAPALLAPADNVDVQFLPRFSWTAVEAARDYRLEISTQPDFTHVTLRLYHRSDRLHAGAEPGQRPGLLLARPRHRLPGHQRAVERGAALPHALELPGPAADPAEQHDQHFLPILHVDADPRRRSSTRSRSTRARRSAAPSPTRRSTT